MLSKSTNEEKTIFHHGGRVCLMHMQPSEDPPQDFSISAPKQVKTSRLTDEKGTSLKLQALPSYRNNCYMSLKQLIYETSLVRCHQSRSQPLAVSQPLFCCVLT